MRRLTPTLLLAPALLAAPNSEQRFTLPNGLRVLLLEDHGLPQVRVQVAQDFEGAGGFSALTGALNEGAGGGPYSATALAHTLEERGAWLESAWRPGRLEWRLVVGSPELEGALELLGHTVFRPSVEASRMERTRAQMVRQAQECSIQELAQDRFLAGLGHPEGGRIPPEAELRPITPQALAAFRRGIADPRRATVVLQGDLSLPLAQQVMLQSFGTWTPAPSPSVPSAEIPATLETQGLPALAWGGRRIAFTKPSELEAFSLLAEVFAEREAGPFHLEWVQRDQHSGVMVARGAASLAELQRRLGELGARGISPREFERAQITLRRERAMLPLHPPLRVEEGLNRDATPPPVGEPSLAQVRGLLEVWLRPEGLRLLLVKDGQSQ